MALARLRRHATCARVGGHLAVRRARGHPGHAGWRALGQHRLEVEIDRLLGHLQIDVLHGEDLGRQALAPGEFVLQVAFDRGGEHRPDDGDAER